ncbi:ABC transporter substrate-binding protein [Azospirillum sp. sgz301742]
MTRRRTGLFALAVSALLGCATPAAAASLTLGLKQEPSALDPHFHHNFPNNSSLSHVFEHLVEQDARLGLQPGLAVSWTALDATTWEFKLRPDAKWHDGTPFTADDVVFTFERVPNVPNSPGPFTVYTKRVIKVEAVDPLTVRMVTDGPNPLLPYDLALVFVVSRQAGTGAATADYNSGKAMVGTGPYRFVEYKPGERLVLARNPGWHGAPPAWDGVTERYIPKDSARAAALLAGDVDVVDNVPTADLATLRADRKVTLTSGPGARVMHIQLDSARDASPFVTAKDGSALAKNPLKDARVRRALSLAINRAAIVDRLMEGEAIAAGQLFALPEDGKGVPAAKQDLDAAKALLAEAGWKDGFKLTLHATNDRYPNDAKVAQAVGQMLTRIGLTVEVEALPGNIYFSRGAKQEFSMMMGQFGTYEASQGLRATAHSYDGARGYGTANRTRYVNAELDRLIDSALVAFDPASRAKLIQEAEELLARDAGVIPLYFPKFTLAARKGIAAEVYADGRVLATAMKPVP